MLSRTAATMNYLDMLTTLRSAGELQKLARDHHVLLRLGPSDRLILDPQEPIPADVEEQITKGAEQLVAAIKSERDEWLHHWRGLIQDLTDGFDAYMSDDCTEAEQNRWIGLLNLTEYTEVQVLRTRYGFTGCPAEGGVCDPGWPMVCSFCAAGAA